MEGEGNQTNAERVVILSTETDDLELMPSWSQTVLTEQSLYGEIPTTIKSGVHDGLAQNLEVLGGVPIGANSWNEWF